MEKPAKILIIDDNSDYLFSMGTFLERNGFKVLKAEDGRKGLDMIKNDRPDLILLDVMMESTYSGLEVCKKVRGDSEVKDIPIIGISAMGDELGVHVDKWGNSEYFDVDEYLEKPVDKEKLLQRINVRLKKGVIRKPGEF